jgi:hypothetical protein
VAEFLLSLDKEGRTPDLRWLDEEGCAVVHRVAAAGDVPLLEHLLQVRGCPKASRGVGGVVGG